MPPDYIGAAIKFAHTEDEAAKLLGKYDKKAKTILDGRGSLLSNIQIHEEKS